MSEGLRAFRHPNFRLFWAGQLISLVGTWMQTIAQNWLVLELTNDPFALGLTAVAQFAPVIVLGLFGGIVADVLPKRGTLLVANAASGLLALGLGTLVASGQVQVWHVFLFAGLLGVVNAVEMPVRQSFVVEMVGRDDVPNAIGLNSALFNGSRIVGPAIAGLVIGAVGIAACFFVNAVSFIGVLVALVAMRPEALIAAPRAALQRTWRGVVDQLTEGVRYARETPVVRLGLLVLGVVATASMNLGVLMPILARDVLGGGADTFGFLMAATGIGALVAALTIAFGVRPTPRQLVVGPAVLGIGLCGVAFSRDERVTLALMLLVGWGGISMAATANTLIQLAVPDELRGRVMSLYVTVFAGSTPVGGLLSGFLAARLGVALTVFLSGLIALAVAAFAATRVAALAHAGPPVAPETG
jgi:MFS family permease